MNIFENCKNSKIQGNIGLGAAIKYFSALGCVVSLPLNDSQDYDLIIDDGDSLHKVQVRTTNYITKIGNYVVNLRVLGGNSKSNYVHKTANQIIYDILFVLCGNGDAYVIPKKDIQHLSNALTLCKQYRRFKIEL